MTCLFCYGDCGFKDCPDSRYYHDADDYYEDEWYEEEETETDAEYAERIERGFRVRALDALYADVLPKDSILMQRNAFDGTWFYIPF